MKKFDRVKAVVSLDAIAHNFEEMKKISQKEQRSLLLSRQTVMDTVRKQLRV